jgi:glutamine amidotransferase
MTKEGKRYKVPHMGWNELIFHQRSPLFDGVERGHVYFVHSYYVQTNESTVVLASAQYDVEVPAVVGRGTIFGTQFHPEKSGTLGMRLLQNYARIVERERG